MPHLLQLALAPPQQARHARGGSSGGSGSPHSPCGRVELQQLLDAAPAAASVSVPAWLTAAAASAGVAAVLASLSSGVLLLIPRQVRGGG